MHRNDIFYVLISITNRVLTRLISMLSLPASSALPSTPRARPIAHAPLAPHACLAARSRTRSRVTDVSFLCVVKTQIRWSNKIYKTELTKTRYNNQVLGKYRVDPQTPGLTLITELTWSNLGLKEVLNKRK